MSMYQIVAYIENIKIGNDGLKIQIKGAGKYLFEDGKDNEKYSYNILKPVDNHESKPETIKATEAFDLRMNIGANVSLCFVSHILSQAFVDNKRLKFGIAEDKRTITSISKES